MNHLRGDFRLGVCKRTTALSVLLLGFSLFPSQAQTFNTLVIFNGVNGATPIDTPLVQGTDGSLYGTTFSGGASGHGTVFKISTGGTLTTIYSFCPQTCTDGSGPYGGLVLGSDGNLYGTTEYGGVAFPGGTVFRITPTGILKTLHSFTDGSDGAGPVASMVQGRDGNFYGITQNGGGLSNAGTIFKITAKGVLTTLHVLGPSDGNAFNSPLIQASDGNFYGTTEFGAGGYGSIFRVTPGGTFSTLYGFDSTNGSVPSGGLVQASDGSMYGTTFLGGTGSCPILRGFAGCGTAFKITLGGALTTLHNFSPSEPVNPAAGLVIGIDGNFYGTSYAGGTTGWGTVFEITPEGKVTTLHSFSGDDGGQLEAPVSQSTNGNLYGTATTGLDAATQGTVFDLTTTLGSFVSFVRNSGEIGQTMEILGQGFTGTTSVALNGIPANFRVLSNTFLTATVPLGSTTGYVTVSTPGGTLTSNVAFHVFP